MALWSAFAAVVLERLLAGDPRYLIWSDRELVRAASGSVTDLTTYGAELSYGEGARTPGGALHLVLWVTHLLDPDPLLAWRVQVGLDALGGVLVGVMAARWLGPMPGAVAAVLTVANTPDAQTQVPLWNPAFVAGPVAAATTAWVVRLATLDGRWTVPWALAMAVAAHAHVISWLLVAAMIPPLFFLQPRNGVRWTLAAGLAALSTFVPYLVEEVRTGFRNGRTLLLPGQVEDLTTPVLALARPGATALDAIITLASQPSMVALGEATHPAVTIASISSGALIAAGIVLSLRPVDDASVVLRRRVLLALLWTVGAVLVALARSRAYQFSTSDQSRYLVILGPTVAWISAIAVSNLLEVLTVRPLLRTAAVVALLADGAVHAAALHLATEHGRGDAMAWGRKHAWIDALRLQTGWSVADVAGRTLQATPGHVAPGGKTTWVAAEAAPMDAMLVEAHSVWPGPLPPPCVAVLVQHPRMPRPELDSDGLRALLGPGHVGATLHDALELGPGVRAFRYTPADGPCPTNQTQRYVPTREEAEVQRLVPPLTPGAVRVMSPGADGSTRWAVGIPTGDPRTPEAFVRAVITARRSGDELHVELHGNQLRGPAWNGGTYANVTLLEPRLELTSDDGATTAVRFAPRLVGTGGLPTPLRAEMAAPPHAMLTFVTSPRIVDGHEVHAVWIPLIGLAP